MAARPPKQQRKPFNDQTAQPQPNSRGPNRPAWRTSGGPSFAHAARQNTNFPPLGGNQNNQQQRQDYDPKLIASLTPQVGNPIILNLKNGSRHEGIVVSTTSEGDSVGVTLKNVKDLGNPASSAKDSHHFPAASCQGWVHPQKPTNGVGHDATFRTDTEISSNANGSRERELKQWQPDPAADTKTVTTDEAFGALGTYSGGAWDQFDANEQLFGVTTSFDEAAYTTKLDRSAPDFKERERKAQQIADEINRSVTSNPHVAAERQMNGGPDDGAGEEEKYSAVVRGANAYVPPGARKSTTSGTATPSSQPTSGPAATPKLAAEEGAKASEAGSPAGTVSGSTPAPTKPADSLVGSFRDFVTNEKQRLTQRKQALAKSEMDKRKADLVKFSKTFKLNKPIPEDLIPILAKDEEKQKAILEKAKADVEASAKASPGGSSSAVNGARPSVAKDIPTAAKPASAKPATPTASTSAGEASKKAKTSMFIQPIPPFNKSKIRPRPSASVSGTPATINAMTTGTPTSAGSSATPTPAATGAPVSPTSSHATSNANANNIGLRLNPNASAFRPNPTAPAFKPTSPAVPSPKVKDTKEVASPPTTSGPNAISANTAPPNPFFGTRVPPKKGAPVHLKDDFNPFRHAKVSEASAVSSMWQYSGKRFASMFPSIPPSQPHHPQVMSGVVQGVAAPSAPPPYEEDPAVANQAAVRQQQQQQQQHPQQPQYPIMYYPQQYPYAAPIQPHSQPSMIMQGQAPTFMPGPYMHPMPYPHHMQPAPGMYGGHPPNMPGVPPGPHYMAPPGAYPPTSPPPNGTPRGPPGTMPGAPMPPHGYYHPSPPMGHAVPYSMMMGPPPQQGPPHFDPSQGPPQQVPPMAGAGH